ncbi:YrhB domain-containing protein [Micromonospora sp. WMMD882]|uniref:YrhB domain-containing protein n=1 Tax=Micromonospora sp. WMMD882 TaxID=3015151 RepID=UPI00248D32DB|nr:YrhB domain-containing protein [Micromonospora sp. WMMD882]WBB80447.1 YrhB domain-containing protein [Micromonospora sp. WMMD882]
MTARGADDRARRADGEEWVGMDADEARRLAGAKLRELADPAEPLRLAPEPPVEYPWCWVFPFDTERWYRTGALPDAALAGPLVVDKGTGLVWQAPSAPPLERWLNAYGAQRGLPAVPVPPPASPW